MMAKVKGIADCVDDNGNYSFAKIKEKNAKTAQALASSGFGKFKVADAGAFVVDVLAQRANRKVAPACADSVRACAAAFDRSLSGGARAVR